jgi:DNA processing protein
MGKGKGHEIVLSLVLSGAVPLRGLSRHLRSLSADDLASATPASLARALDLPADGRKAIARGLSEASSMIQDLRTAGHRLVTLSDADYPPLLKEVASPPPVLFYRGTLSALGYPAVAIVGARKASLAAVRITLDLARDLAGRGFTIVSGLARGIDTAAHRGALEAGGRTVAVLGCGIDVVYPAENEHLAGAICDAGAVITEQLPATAPLRQNFPQRNRIISGLSLGTVVVEAGEVSGALITAAYALDQNRSVFAVPSTPGLARSRGSNRLLKEGATLVESADDIVSELGPQIELGASSAPGAPDAAKTPETGKAPGLFDLPELTREEERVVGLLSDAPVHIDEISRDLRLGSRDLLRLLLTLETRGVVRTMPGKFYIREGAG